MFKASTTGLRPTTSARSRCISRAPPLTTQLRHAGVDISTYQPPPSHAGTHYHRPKPMNPHLSTDSYPPLSASSRPQSKPLRHPTSVCQHTSTHTHTHARTHARTNTHVYTHVCVCVCVCVCEHTSEVVQERAMKVKHVDHVAHHHLLLADRPQEFFEGLRRHLGVRRTLMRFPQVSAQAATTVHEPRAP